MVVPSNETIANLILPIVNLEGGIRVPIIGACHPCIKALQRRSKDAPRQIPPTTVLTVYEDVYASGRHILTAERDRPITRTSVLADVRNASVKSRRIGTGRLQKGCDGAKEDVGTGTGDAVEISILRLASGCSIGWRLSVSGIDVA